MIYLQNFDLMPRNKEENFLNNFPRTCFDSMSRMSASQFVRKRVGIEQRTYSNGENSPFILSLPGAKIYNMDSEPITTCRWTEVPNVKIYHEFFSEHQDEF